MEKWNYSFSDEVAINFCYDIENKKITVGFNGYFDLITHEYKEVECLFVIEKWLDAKSKVDDNIRFYDLDKHMGIFSLILYMKREEDFIELLVNTIDERYITLRFKDPTMSLLEK